MTDNLDVKMTTGVTIEGVFGPCIGLHANVSGHPRTSVWLPAQDTTEPRKCTQELLRAGLKFFDQSKMARALKAAFANPLPEARRVVRSNGWHGRDFVHAGHLCREASNSTTRLHQTVVRQRVRYPTREDRKLIDFIEKNAPLSDYLAVATMIAFAQPLLGLLPMSERPIIYFWGDSRTGKSTLAKLIIAITRPPGDRKLVSFKTSERAMEERLERLNDSVAVYDETGVVGENLDRIFSSFVYTAANGVGKARSESSGYADLSWRTTTVLTGEVDFNALPSRQKGGGQDARLLLVSIPEREEGGIWSKDVKKRGRKTKELGRFIGSHSGHVFTRWVGYVVRNQDALRKKMDETTAKYTRMLVGENPDSLLEATATKYAQLAAAGRLLIEAKVINWERNFPLHVVQRLLEAQRVEADQPKMPEKTSAQEIAMRILAHAYVGQFPEGKPSLQDGHPAAFMTTRGGKNFIMIEKSVVAKFLGGQDKERVAALRAAGLTVSHGTTPYFQARNVGSREVGKSYLRLDVGNLISAAFPSAI